VVTRTKNPIGRMQTKPVLSCIIHVAVQLCTWWYISLIVHYNMSETSSRVTWFATVVNRDTRHQQRPTDHRVVGSLSIQTSLCHIASETKRHEFIFSCTLAR